MDEAEQAEMNRLRWMERQFRRLAHYLRQDAGLAAAGKLPHGGEETAETFRFAAQQVEDVLAAGRGAHRPPLPEDIAANLASLNEIIAEMTAKVSDDPEFTRGVKELLGDHSAALGYEFQGRRSGG
jgi:hypothetical protein